MGSFGERMRREREMRGITLEEIAESTKIGTRSLRALEAEDFDKLPGGIFNKGFVRAYSKYLGIDEEQAVADFGAALDEYQKQAPQLEPAQTAADEEPEPPSVNLLIAIAAGLVLALGVGIWMFRAPIAGAARKAFHKVKGTASQSEPTVAAAPKPLPVATPTPTPDPATASPSPDNKSVAAVPVPAPTAAAPARAVVPAARRSDASAAGEFVLNVHARQDSWVSITADDQLLMEGVLKGDKTVRAKSRVVFRTGNAGAIDISFNGQPLPALGADNQVRTVVFTADGIQR